MMDARKLNVPIITLISGIAFAVTSTSTAIWWASNIEARLESQERQTKEQWKRIAMNSDIKDEVIRNGERLKTLMEVVKKND